MSQAEAEIRSGGRFAFGDNWAHFVELLDDARIAGAVASLQKMLGVEELTGRTFVDVGSGSGLFSLAARSLGADVVSFDYDPASVGCTLELRRRYFGCDSSWRVLEGSALDLEFIRSLGQFDIVYSWGVLHHTGDLWSGLVNVIELTKPGSTLFIAVYNDQGRKSDIWAAIKRRYSQAGRLGRVFLLTGADIYFRVHGLKRIYHLLLRDFGSVKQPRDRGMNRRHDLIDWIGGYPFEVAKPEDIFTLYHDRGFTLERLVTCGGGIGCNQFVFHRPDALAY